jgi:hypothetical protein
MRTLFVKTPLFLFVFIVSKSPLIRVIFMKVNLLYVCDCENGSRVLYMLRLEGPTLDIIRT